MKKITSLFLLPFFLSCNSQVKPNDVPLRDEVKNYTCETVTSGIAIPWGMAWLPDGSMLITEKSGILYHLKNGQKTKIKNVPAVYDHGQGGLLDIVLHPNYNKSGWIYITYASTVGGGKGSKTKLFGAKR